MKKKHYTPTIIICVALIASVYYVFFRQNEIEVRLEQSKIIFNERIRNIELEGFPLRLQLDFNRLLLDFKNIQLRKEWTAELSFDLTLQPFFDLRNVYLISFDKIAVYDKNTMENIWRRQMDHNIESFSLINGNNALLIDSGGNVHALNRTTGKTAWTYSFDGMYISNNSFAARPFQISSSEDRRLLTSLVILPINNEIKVLDNLSGEVLFALKFDDHIFYLSEYDPINHAIYVAYGNRIAKIILETR